MGLNAADWGLERRESLDSQLSRRLLEYVLSGDISPGQRLPSERVLAERLKVSRQAVRNAIKSLAMLGLIETRMGSGSYLANQQSDLLPRVIEWGVLLSETWAADLLDARMQLEVMFATLAAERRTSEQLNALTEAFALMESSKDDYEAYAEADAAFHIAVAVAAGNSVLAGVLVNIRVLLKAWAAQVITYAGETETSLPMHEAVLSAVRRQDPVGARKAMQEHMDRALKRLRESQIS